MTPTRSILNDDFRRGLCVCTCHGCAFGRRYYGGAYLGTIDSEVGRAPPLFGSAFVWVLPAGALFLGLSLSQSVTSLNSWQK